MEGEEDYLDLEDLENQLEDIGANASQENQPRNGNSVDIDVQDLINESNEESSDDELQLLPSELINAMEEAWMNEKFAPEILPHKFELVETILTTVEAMEENISTLENSDFLKGIYQMEVDRLRYLVTSYIRTRLEKIELFAASILQEDLERAEKRVEAYLTENETEFAKNYIQDADLYFRKVLPNHPSIAATEWRSNPLTPNRHSFVFLKSKRRIQGIVIDDGEAEEDSGDLVDLEENSQAIISYNSIANLLKNDQVQLI